MADHRETNPGLHLLYVKWAVVHLTMIRRSMDYLSTASNCNMFPSVAALGTEYEKLVRENPAYADAEEILQSLEPHGLRFKPIRKYD